MQSSHGRDVRSVAGRCVLLVAMGERCSVRDARSQLLGVAFKVCVYDEEGAQLMVLVLEREGGVVPTWHLHPLGPDWLAMRNVVNQEVGPAEDLEAVDARVIRSLVPRSLGDEAAQVLHEYVVAFLAIGQQQQVDVVWLVAELGDT